MVEGKEPLRGVRGHDPLVSERPGTVMVALRGRCGECEARISPMYPAVELSTAIGSGLVAWLVSPPWLAVALGLMVLLAVVLAAIHFRHMRLPASIVYAAYPIVVSGLVVDALVRHHAGWLLRGLGGAGIALAIYGGIWLIYPAGIGLGDVRLVPSWDLCLRTQAGRS